MGQELKDAIRRGAQRGMSAGLGLDEGTIRMLRWLVILLVLGVIVFALQRCS